MTDRLAKLVALRKAVETGEPFVGSLTAQVFAPEHHALFCRACGEGRAADSTDAALTLLGDVLPAVSWSIMFEPEDEGREYYASMNHHTNDEMRFIHEFAPTLARALLLAMLSALIERERQP